MTSRVILIVLIALSGCRDASDILSAEELAAQFEDERKIVFERFGYTGTAMIFPDQKFKAHVPRLGDDRGIWWLDENQMCSRWEELRKGRVLCAFIGRLPDGTYEALSPKAKARLGTFRFTN